MTDGKPPKLLRARDCWALLPEPLAASVLSVLDAAFERRAPFNTIEFSPFDLALAKLPPPSGLTSDQVRRGVFEELNNLPWSDGLQPPEGGSWLRHSPVATGVDRVFVIPRDPYRLTRKVAKAAVDRMRAGAMLGPEVGVELSGGLEIHQGKSGGVRVWQGLRAVYRAAPHVHSELKIYYLDQVPAMVRPSAVFLDPSLGNIGSDEEAEHVIRQMWGYGDLLYRALVEALHSGSQPLSEGKEPSAGR